MAQSEATDTIKTQDLGEIVVEAQMQRTGTTSTTYTPSGKQKTFGLVYIDNRKIISGKSPAKINRFSADTSIFPFYPLV